MVRWDNGAPRLSPTLRLYLELALDALHGGFATWSVLSTDERIAVALALNRHGWLSSMNCTMAQAIERMSPDWLACLPVVEGILQESGYDLQDRT
ncbi:MAG: hypothetical protein Q4G70_04405 [Pseudomonadota bacterium]|nr:hypothetical protein [Pseudomonadota bacterium]